ITQVLFPNILHILPIPVSSTVMTTFSLATIIAITKFKFLSITPAIANNTIVNTIADAIFIINPEGTLDYINQEAEHRFKIPQQEAERYKIDELLAKETSNIDTWKKEIIK